METKSNSLRRGQSALNVQTDDGAIYRSNLRHLLHIADTEATNMTSESIPAPTPNVVNQLYQTAANDVCSSNTPITTSGRNMLRVN